MVWFMRYCPKKRQRCLHRGALKWHFRTLQGQQTKITVIALPVFKGKQLIAKLLHPQFRHFGVYRLDQALWRKPIVAKVAIFTNVSIQQRNVRAPEFPVDSKLICYLADLLAASLQRTACSVPADQTDLDFPSTIEPAIGGRIVTQTGEKCLCRW